MLTIEFDNPVFHEGVNVTVRNGPKWANRARLGDYIAPIPTGADQSVPMTKTDCVIGVFYCSLNELPEGLIQHEHDPACRTKEGLAAELDRIYGPEEDRMVTALVWYRNTKS